ncbi:MAG: site-specific DNA-methyltransferase [Pseudomonadota bacterium]
MTELVFKGKEFVYNHHLAVPFRPLVPHPERGIGPVALDGNLIIHGDNLHALKALLPLYAGKVDCIFIDPPYNTGNEGWCYNDNVNAPMIKEWLESNPIGIEDGLRHDKWCAMMWPRLRLLHELLSDNGALFVSIDDNELSALIRILSDIFSREPTAVIPVVNNLKGRNDKKNFARAHEYVVVFDKGNFVARGLPLTEEQLKEYKHVDDRGEKYALRDLRKRGGADTRELRPKLFYPIYFNVEDGTASLERKNATDVEVLPFKKDGTEGCWRWGKKKVEANLGIIELRKGSTVPGASYRVYLNPDAQLGALSSEDEDDIDDTIEDDEGDDEAIERTSKSKSFWIGPELSTDGANKLLKAIMSGTGMKFDYPKPVALIERILAIGADRDALILDSFAGSGTTAHAVLEANKRDGGNRRFILVEMEDYADSLTAERVRRVINGYEFKGTQKTELLRERLNWRSIKNAADLVHKVEAIENLHGHEYDRIKKEVKDGELIVTGEKTVTERAEGLGGTFTYCTLGDPVELDEVLTGETLPSYAGLGAVLFHMATNQVLDPATVREEDFYLGATEGQHVWLIYKPDLDWLKSPEAALTLARARAFAATDPDKKHLVFAPARFVSQKMLAEQNIPVEFVPLPFALYRIERS